MSKFAACVDRYHAQKQLKSGGPTFGRKAKDVKAAQKAQAKNKAATKTALNETGFEMKVQIPARHSFGDRFEPFEPFEPFKTHWAKVKPLRYEDIAKAMNFGLRGGMSHSQVVAHFARTTEQADVFMGPDPFPIRITNERGYYSFGCDLPPTEDMVELAKRRCGRRSSRERFKLEYGRLRLAQRSKTVRVLHEVLKASEFKIMGSGVSRTVYVLSKNTVLKVPNVADQDCFGANINELRLWKKHRRRGVIKLAACRKIDILGVPCLIMQRVHVPGQADCRKGQTRTADAPAWASRLDGNQCALTARGEWVAYDYGYQYGPDIIRPLTEYEQTQHLAALKHARKRQEPAPRAPLGSVAEAAE